jgi:hypothetical protein
MAAVIAAALAAGAGLGTYVANQPTSSARPHGTHRTTSPAVTAPAPAACTPSAILVNPCRPWFGAVANGNPGAPSSRVAQFDYLERLIGRRLDIFRDYHTPPGHGILANLPLNYDERQLARQPHTYLDVNWKPARTFALADGGDAAVNRQIDQAAASIRSIAPRKIFLTIWWEPQNDVTSDPGGHCYVNSNATGGTPAQYVAMWQNVESRFRADGVTNVVWAMDYQAPPSGQYDCLVPQLWPGNGLVDWVLYDTYSRTSQATWANTVGRFYHVLIRDSSPRVNFESKPWGLGEFGTCTNPDTAAADKFYLEAKRAFAANAYPRLKMYLVYASTAGPKAGPGCLSDYSSSGRPDPAKQANLNQFASTVLGHR